MMHFIRAAVIAAALCVPVSGWAQIHPRLKMLAGGTTYMPGSMVDIKWTGGDPAGKLRLTVDRKVGSGAWTQPFRHFTMTQGLVATTATQPQVPNITNTGSVNFAIPPNSATWRCGPNVSYRFVVSGYPPTGYGAPFHIACR
jgi:hypothetical protein